jgi:hypothetical protein
VGEEDNSQSGSFTGRVPSMKWRVFLIVLHGWSVEENLSVIAYINTRINESLFSSLRKLLHLPLLNI